MNVTIRALTESDLAAYRAFRVAALTRDREAFTSSAEEAAAASASSHAARLGAPETGHFALGAFDDDHRLVGSIACEREQRAKARHAATLIAMMVAADCQGRGIGRRLLDECVRLASTAAGLEQLRLSVTASNLTAIHLYEQAGFARYGLLPRALKIDGRYHDKLLMQRTLDRDRL